MLDDTGDQHVLGHSGHTHNKTTEAQAIQMQGCTVYRVECLMLKRGVVEVVVGALLGKQLWDPALVNKQRQAARWVQL